MTFWYYYGPYVPGVFSYDENVTTEEHVEIYSASDTDVLEGEISGEDDSDKDDDIRDKDLDVGEAALAYAPDVHLSTGELTKYDIAESGLLNCFQRRW